MFDLAGHEEPRVLLRRAVEAGRIASCYLFVGPDGIGKTTLARWFAALLSCASESRPCGRCGKCRRLAEGSCPDLTVFEEYGHPMTLHRENLPGAWPEQVDAALDALHTAELLAAKPRGLGNTRVCHLLGPDSTSADPEAEVTKALKGHESASLAAQLARRLFLRGGTVRYTRSLKIDLIRRFVLRQVPLRPVEMNYRLFLLDDAHTMPIEAQNALLKTLEEPPPSSILILLTSKPNQLLPTIVSRCQKVILRGLNRPALTGLLQRLGAPEEDAQVSAEQADGSVLQALDFDAAEHRLRRDALLEALLEKSDPTSTSQGLVKALTVAGSSDRQERHRSISKQLVLLQQLLRDALALANGANTDRLRHQQSEARLAQLARQGSIPLQRAAEVTLEMIERFATNAAPDLQVLAAGGLLQQALAGTSLPKSRPV